MNNLLYHYTGSDGFLGIIGSKILWASNIHYLNDYREFLHGISVTKQMVGGRQQHLAGGQDKRGLILNVLYHSIQSQLDAFSSVAVFVVSFTENNDQLSQWRGYCPDGGGFSIGFEKTEIERLAKKQGFVLSACIYDHQPQREIINRLLTNAEDRTLKLNVGDKNGIVWKAREFIVEIVNIVPLFKDPSFHEEKEWRLFYTDLDQSKKTWQMRTGKSTIVPYIEYELDDGNGSIPLKNIVAGPGHPQPLTISSLGSYLRQSGITDCSCSTSGVPYRTV